MIGFEKSAGSTESGGTFKPLDQGSGRPKAGAAGGVIGFEKSAGSHQPSTGFKPLDPTSHKPMYASAPAGVLFSKSPGTETARERPDLIVRGHAGAAGGVLEGKALSSGVSSPLSKLLEGKGTGSGGTSLLNDKGGGSAAGGVLGRSMLNDRGGGGAAGGVLERSMLHGTAGGSAPGGVLEARGTGTAPKSTLQEALATKAGGTGGWLQPAQDAAFSQLDQAILGLKDRYGNEPLAIPQTPTVAPAQPSISDLLEGKGRGVVNASQHNGKGEEWLSQAGGGAAGGVLGDL